MTNSLAEKAFPQNSPDPLDILRRSLSSAPLLPGDAGYGEETAGFNAAVRHRPAVVVRAGCADDVVAAVRHARATGVPVAVQSTGHGALRAVEGGVLISTRRLDEVSVDPAARRVRVGAGVRWAQVIEAAAPYELAPPSGSSSGVGVVGYTLGGGLGPLGRRYGWAADHVHAVELVTGDGVLRRVTAESDPELFWAVRGGKGNLGVVTALEIGLFPVSRLYGGGLFFAGEHATRVLHAWREWVAGLPEETSTSVALLRLPDLPHVPPPLRARLSVHVRVTHLGAAADGERLVAPLRAAAPTLLDSLGELPFTAVDSVHNDPHDPIPFWEKSSALSCLPAEAVDALLATAGPDADGQGGPLPLVMVELRLLGGALARPAAVPNAVSGRDSAFNVFVLGMRVPGLEQAVPAAASRVLESLRPWDAGVRLVNFLGEVTDPAGVASAWSPRDADRLAAQVSRCDPDGLFRWGHALPRPGDRR